MIQIKILKIMNSAGMDAYVLARLEQLGKFSTENINIQFSKHYKTKKLMFQIF